MADAPDVPALIRNRDTARFRRYADLLAFYKGAQWDSPPTRLTRTGQRRLTFNYAEAFITKSASYMMAGATLVADPQGDTQRDIDLADQAEVALRQVADDNALDALDFDTELDCSVLGDAAYKVTYDPIENRVRVSAADVTALHVWRRPDDVRDVWRVAQRYDLPADDLFALYGVRSSSRRSKSTIVEAWTPDTFDIWIDGEHVRADVNPYGFIPYVVYPNVRRPMEEWGTSDIEAIREAAREFNRLATQLSLIVELSGNPIAVLEGVSESTDIAIAPGAVWELPADAKAYLLDLLKSGGTRIAIQFAELIRNTMHDLGETPATSFGNNDRALSGVALNVALDPLVKKIARKRLIRSRALRERNAMILSLLGQFGGLAPEVAAHPTRVEWGDVLPNDRSKDIADEVALVTSALRAPTTAMAALGEPDPVAELARWEAESKRITEVKPAQAPTPQAAQNRTP